MGHYVAQVEDVRERDVQFEMAFDSQQDAVDELRNRYGLSEDAAGWLRQGESVGNEWLGRSMARVYACECRMPFMHEIDVHEIIAVA